MFNDKYGLTEAVLSGRKTQTRRIATSADESPKYKVGEIVAIAQNYDIISEEISKEPSHEKALFYCKVMKEHYPKETDPRDKEEIPGWYNKMFVRADLMPHQIRITNVRVERLHEISDEDCLKEGILINNVYDDYPEEHVLLKQEYYVDYPTKGGHAERRIDFDAPRDVYACLIDKISGKGTWESNPYVFVYDFELVK